MVDFVGAGPGAPDLITLRGRELLERADCIIYAGSLVNPALLSYAKKDCEMHNSAHMHLEEVLAVMERVEAQGKNTVRLHTGDPSLYGAIREQMDALKRRGIPYRVCPGVSSFCGAAAALEAEYTLPGVSQSVIISRMEGRTPVPPGEKLHLLAQHGATMVLFLSSGMAERVQAELLRGAYTERTPCAIVYKATWQEEKVLRGTVGELCKLTAEHHITDTALIVVGDVLGDRYELSKLYDKYFTTGYRTGETKGETEMGMCNPNATKAARELWEYLRKTGGQGLITGQHTQTVAMEEIDEIRRVTGREPALRGFELLSYSPNIRYETGDKACTTEIDENRNTLECAMDFAAKGGILTFTWHWFSPIGGWDKSFYAEKTDFDPEKILTEGTAEREAFYHDMDVMAGYLKPFLEKDIPILWRPFHEAEGKWFWWGRKGPAVAAQLFRLMYAHFVGVHRLDNLIWVWNCPLKEGYPGDDVVDVISRDLYSEKGTKTDYAKEYEELRAVTDADKPVALAETGILPDMDMLEKSRVPWCYFMTWSKEFALGEAYNSYEALRKIYNSSYAITYPAGWQAQQP